MRCLASAYHHYHMHLDSSSNSQGGAPVFWFAIPVHNRWDYTAACLDSIREQSLPDWQVVVCDDGSTDGTSEKIAAAYPEVHLLQGDGSLWWSESTNRCVRHVLEHARPGDFVVTLNNDLVLSHDYLERMKNAVQAHPSAIITSASYDIEDRQRLVDPGQRLSWLMAKQVWVDPGQRRDDGLAEVSHAPGRGTVFPTAVFERLGLFAASQLPQYAADYDMSLRAARAGYKIYINYEARLYSHVEATGSTAFVGGSTLSNLYRFLTDIRSPACLKYRWRFARRNCPWYLQPSYIALDTIRVLWGYFFGARKKVWRGSMAENGS